MADKKKHVYIIGSKGIPAKYGGFETFVEKLTEYQVDQNIQYHVACMTENSAKSGITDKHFEHNGAKCFNIDVPNIGPARAIYYDVAALKFAINISRTNNDTSPIFYVLACRIGPFIRAFKKQIKDLGGQLFVNPDGHEWLREKWNYPIRKYWKISEKIMVKHSDILICDSQNIEKYIYTDYSKYNPKTRYIAYGTDVDSIYVNSEIDYMNWCSEKGISKYNYYLIVGRFVPENNYELMIKEFVVSNTRKNLVIITNVDNKKFFDKLKKNTGFQNDKRVKFVGTVYDQSLLKLIRQNAFAYLHGHEVGGTNPTLLEALSTTPINLLLDVSFNKEVGQDGALYFSKEKNCLANMIDEVENFNKDIIYIYEKRAKNRIVTSFSWDFIVSEYEKEWVNR